MTGRTVVIGSGAGGATAAMALAEAGLDVTILEKGTNYFGHLTAERPETLFHGDEIRSRRAFAPPDLLSEPRVWRSSPSDSEPVVGSVQPMPQTVGGATVHWDAKTPRFWDIDFSKLSMLGPVEGAAVEDWPFSYDEIAPFYDEIEELIGVQGELSRLPELTLRHAPRSGPLPMPAGPPQYSSVVVSAGCERLGLHPYPSLMAINSRNYGGRPACTNCGMCSGYACAIQARGSSLQPLRRALLAGAELIERSTVTGVMTKGRHVTGVSFLDASGRNRAMAADQVVMAANAIETVRLAIGSRLPDPFSVTGRYVMFHWFTLGSAIFLGERLHAHIGRDHTHEMDDFADPDFEGAQAAAKEAGLPYFRGGKLELGGSQPPVDEAAQYQAILSLISPDRPFGSAFKQLMRASLLRDRLLGVTMVGEDLPYASNQVDLDPALKDWRGSPVARVTYGPGPHELAAQAFYLPWIRKLLDASGADVAIALPDLPSVRFPIAANSTLQHAHVMGGMRMGADPHTSVTDGTGRHHHLDNLFVADGSVFPSSGAHNPTLTLMATALRNARLWT
ncbi:MAG: GMC oxidoreductase [Acidimicrobiales bacterium]